MSANCGNLDDILKETGEILNETSGITQSEAAGGLRQALEKGVGYGTSLLSAKDGFFKNAAYKILFPSEAKKVENTLRNLGMGNLCDQMIESMNRGAEKAAAEAKPIFINAIKQMTINDAINIVTGGNGAATDYLTRTTTSQLKAKFKPVVQQSLNKVEATKYWGDVFSTYNKIPTVKQKINPDLNEYITDKAMTALFDMVKKEENKIRSNINARNTDLLKKVFGYADRNAK